MASADSRPVPQKNVAYRHIFPIFDADGDLVTGAAGLDSEISKDCGTFTDCTNEATEIATSSGMYYLDLSATEMDADSVAIIIKTSTSGAKTTPVVLYPEEPGDIRVNATQLAGTTLTGRDIGTSVLLSSGTGTGQVSLSSGSVTVGTNNDKTGYSLSSPGISDIRDSVWAKTMTELSSVPGVTADVLSSLNWIFTISRNKKTQTATTETIFKDDGSTTLATSSTADDGTTATTGEYS